MIPTCKVCGTTEQYVFGQFSVCPRRCEMSKAVVATSEVRRSVPQITAELVKGYPVLNAMDDSACLAWVSSIRAWAGVGDEYDQVQYAHLMLAATFDIYIRKFNQPRSQRLVFKMPCKGDFTDADIGRALSFLADPRTHARYDLNLHKVGK